MQAKRDRNVNCRATEGPLRTRTPLEPIRWQEHKLQRNGHRSELVQVPTNIIKLEHQHMNRLPTYDFKQNRAEKAAFITLNLVALALVSLALCDASRFALRVDPAHQEGLDGMTWAAATQTNPVAKGIGTLEMRATEQTAGAPRSHPPKS